MVEGTPLLREHLGKTRIEGSNPSVSAITGTCSLCRGRPPGSGLLPHGVDAARISAPATATLGAGHAAHATQTVSIW